MGPTVNNQPTNQNIDQLKDMVSDALLIDLKKTGSGGAEEGLLSKLMGKLAEALPRPKLSVSQPSDTGKRSMEKVGDFEFRKRPNLKRCLSQSPMTTVRHFREARSMSHFKSALTDNLRLPADQQKSLGEVAKEAAGKKRGSEHIGDKHIAMDGGGEVAKSKNTVVPITYHRNIGDSESNVGYFKATVSPETIEQDDLLAQQAWAVGMAEDNNFTARAVLTGTLDQKLGLGVVTHDMAIEHDGVQGVLSPKADGTPVSTRNDDNTTTSNYFDMSNPKTQKGLTDLQVIDYLTGQVDRHLGNIMIADDGSVTGIDNDQSFGFRNNTEDVNFLAEGFSGSATRNKGIPNLIDKGTADKVAKLSADKFATMLAEGGLERGAINAALERLERFQDKLANGGIETVKTNEWGGDQMAGRIIASKDTELFIQGSEGTIFEYVANESAMAAQAAQGN